MKNLIPIVLILLFSIIGCKLPGQNSSNTGSSGTSNSGTANTSNTAKADPVARATDALKKLRSVPFVTSTFTRGKGGSYKLIEQFSAKDESFSRSSSDDSETKVIIIGKENFSKMNSAWPWRIDSGVNYTAAKTFYFPLDDLERTLPGFNAASEGSETFDGQAAEVFSFKLTEKKLDVPSSVKIWVATETGLPLKLIFEMDDGSTNERTFDYKTPVKIERPKLEKN
ncbi:MAG: hypothetical protein KA956_02900 [Pyrinomonadaceae bacterium]|nr:hypothetical protein [Acidobacteriota bacterium]MBK7932272.1 hypothetical protein [Acidobacteriota bacterium]MBP7375408.1 hypothetical protein [Pyrinomonadaceae bacterium]